MKISPVILIIFVLIQFGLRTTSNAQSPILYQLYNTSDVIVQGTIKEITCFQDEIGVLDCGYALQVDSIYKGIPDIYDIDGAELFHDLQSVTNEEIEKKYRIVYFGKNCFYFLAMISSAKHQFEDQCYKVGDNMIFFLKDYELNIKELMKKDNSIRYGYKMTDQWLGAIPVNSYISRYFRGLDQGKH